MEFETAKVQPVLKEPEAAFPVSVHKGTFDGKPAVMKSVANDRDQNGLGGRLVDRGRRAKEGLTCGSAHVVRVLAVGSDMNRYFVVSEGVVAPAGGSACSVAQLLASADGKQLEINEAIRIVHQVALAMRAASGGREPIWHGCIKPSKIEIVYGSDDARTTGTPLVKVRDFNLGLLRNNHGVDGNARQQGAPFLETALYLAPELIDLHGTPDFRSDVYSLGSVLYHMVTGRPPFQGPTVDDIHLLKLRHRDEPWTGNGPPARLLTCRQMLTSHDQEQLERLIGRMIHPVPENRYGSPDELIKEIVEIAASRGIRLALSEADGDVGPDGLARTDGEKAADANVDAVCVGWGAWRKDQYVVLRHGKTLPSNCVKCGKQVSSKPIGTVARAHATALYILLYPISLVYLLVASRPGRTATVDVHLCSHHRQLRKWTMATLTLAIVACAWLAVVGYLTGLPVVTGGALLMCLALPTVGIMADEIVTAHEIGADRTLLAGTCEKFLRALPTSEFDPSHAPETAGSDRV